MFALSFIYVLTAAQPVRVVYAPMTAMDEPSRKLAAEMDKAILQELSERPQIVVLQREAQGGGADTYTTVTGVHQAWLADADKALDQGKLEHGVTMLQRYVYDATKRPESANLTLLGRAYLALSVTQFRRGKEDEGQEALEELVRLRPDIEVAASAYPPLFVRLHQKALQRWREKSTATLVIEAPESAQITLDGRKVPAGTITDVPAGLHYVALAAGPKQIVRKVDVRQGEVKQVAFGAAGGGKGALAANRFDRSVKRALASVADRQNAAFIVAIAAGVVGSEMVMKALLVSNDGSGGSLGDFGVDLDMLSSSIEAGKIADRVVMATERMPADVELAPLVSAAAVTGQMATMSYFAEASETVAVAPTVKKPVTEPEPQPDAVPKVIVVPQIEPREEPHEAGKPIVVAPGTTPQATTTVQKSKPVYKQWWLWTIVGLAVAGGVTAGVLVGTARVGDVSVSAQW